MHSKPLKLVAALRTSTGQPLSGCRLTKTLCVCKHLLVNEDTESAK